MSEDIGKLCLRPGPAVASLKVSTDVSFQAKARG
jgi:hypothetical protein